jgi:hypothetical protein
MSNKEIKGNASDHILDPSIRTEKSTRKQRALYLNSLEAPFNDSLGSLAVEQVVIHENLSQLYLKF